MTSTAVPHGTTARIDNSTEHGGGSGSDNERREPVQGLKHPRGRVVLQQQRASGADRNTHGEGRPLADPAVHVDITVMQARQFTDQGQPDTGAFVGPAGDVAHLVEPLEQQRHFLVGNADTGVAPAGTRCRRWSAD